MNQPYPGWNQQYPPQPAYGQAPGYPGQPGYGQPQGAYPYGPPPQRPAMAYVAAFLCIPAVAWTYLAAFLSWDGLPDSEGDVDILTSVYGFAFADDLTGNIDAAIAISMSVASTALALVLGLFFRVGVLRWLLAVVALLSVGYYVYHVIWMFDRGLDDFVTLAFLALGLWLLAFVVAVLPPVGRAMRGYRPQAPVAYGQRY